MKTTITYDHEKEGWIVTHNGDIVEVTNLQNVALTAFFKFLAYV